MANELLPYGNDYANLYIEQTTKRSYTITKNIQIVQTAVDLSKNQNEKSNFPFLDVGGNVNTILLGGLGDMIENNIKNSIYYSIDLDKHYFIPNLKNKKSNVVFRKAKNLHSVVGNGEKLPFKDNFANIVLTADVLEHVENPDFVLDEAKRVLKPNGNLLLVIPAFYKLDAVKPLLLNLQRIDDLIDLSGHINFFDKKILIN